MRRLTVLVLSVLLLVGAAVTGSAASASALQRYPDTWITVVRPVNASGHAEPGFTITAASRTSSIDCRFGDPSWVALSPHIAYCSPSAAYAEACWKAAAPRKALCYLDPRSRKLVRYPLYHGVWRDPTPMVPADQRAPLAIVLADGEYCSIRDGGAWERLPGHPNLYGTYACGRNDAVWAVADARHAGVNESQSSWTVRTARFGTRHLVTRHVLRAWFVATATH